MIEIKVPPVGESINEVTLVSWLKKDGDWVERDEVLCELESEKATFELNAEQAGILKIVAQEGQDLSIGDVACQIDETAERPAGTAESGTAPEQKVTEPAATPSTAAVPAQTEAKTAQQPPAATPADIKATPVAAAIMQDKKSKCCYGKRYRDEWKNIQKRCPPGIIPSTGLKWSGCILPQ